MRCAPFRPGHAERNSQALGAGQVGVGAALAAQTRRRRRRRERRGGERQAGSTLFAGKNQQKRTHRIYVTHPALWSGIYTQLHIYARAYYKLQILYSRYTQTHTLHTYVCKWIHTTVYMACGLVGFCFRSHNVVLGEGRASSSRRHR